MPDIAQYLNEYQDNIAEQDQQSSGPGNGPGKPKRPSRTGAGPGQPLSMASLIPEDLDTPVVSQREEINMGRSGTTDISSYFPYMEAGVHTERGDLDRMRAQSQGFWESTGRHLGNFVPNVAAGIIENAGYLGALLTEWGDDRDYSNALTELAKSIKDPLGQVYQESNDVWDIKDPAWWGNNFWQLAQSATQFGLSGAGIGSLFGKLATAAGRLGQAAGTIGRVGGQVATASTLAYMEGAQIGGEVFNKTYQVRLQDLLQAGIDPYEAQEQARGDAANAAATSVQLNTALNTGLNMTALAPMFKSDNQILNWFTDNTALRRGAGEDLGAWTARLRSAASESPELARMLAGGSTLSTLGRLGLEAGQEGIEEVVNQFAERTGYAQGEKGERTGFFNQFAELEHFFDRTMDSEGALNFVLGAFGGVAQTAILDHIPMHRVPIVDSNGNPVEQDGKFQTQLVTSHTKNAMGANRYYNSIVDAIESDVQTYQQQTGRLAKAIADGNREDAQLIRDNILDSRLYNSIMLGQGASWKAEFERIGALDNTTTLTDELTPRVQELAAQRAEAVAAGDQQAVDQFDQQIQQLTSEMATNGESTAASRAGFSSGVGDDIYKRKSQETLKSIDDLSAEWNRINARYNSPMEQQLNYPAFLFQRRADLYRRDNILAEAKREIDAKEAEINRAPQMVGNPNTLFLGQLISLQGHLRGRNKLADQRKALSEAIRKNDVVVMEDLVRKMGGSTETRDLIKAAEDIVLQADAKIQEMDDAGQKMEQMLMTNSRFEDFRKTDDAKGKKLQQQLELYIEQQSASAAQQANAQLLERQRANYETFKAETEMARQQADFYETRKGRDKYLKEAQRASTSAARERYEQMRREAMERATTEADIEAEAEVEYMRGRSEEGKRRLRLYNLRKRMAELSRRRSDLLNRIQTLLNTPLGNKVSDYFGGKRRRLDAIRGIRNEIALVEQQMRQVQAEIDDVINQQNAARQAAVAMATTNPGQNPAPPPPAPAPQPGPTPAPNPLPGGPATNPEIDPGWADLGVTPEGAAPVPASPAPTDNAVPVEGTLPTEDATAVIDQTLAAEAQLDAYLRLLPQDTRRAVENLIDTNMADIMMGFATEVPGDLLAPLVTAGTITPQVASQLMGMIRQVADNFLALRNTTEEASEDAVIQEQVQAEQEEALEEEVAENVATDAMPSEPEPDQEPFTERTSALPQDHAWEEEPSFHIGMQAENINKVNNKALEYDERKDEDGNYRIISVSDSIRDGYPESLVRPMAIRIGDELVLEVDEDYDGTVNVDDEMNTEDRGATQRAANFGEYLDRNGRIRNIDEVPIKITLAKTGEVIGYVPRKGWLEARYAGAANTRNIQDIVYDQQGNAIDNLAIQRERLRTIRQQVVDNWHNGKQPSRTNVNNTGPGQLIYATRVVRNRAQVVDGLTKNRIPDPNISFAISSGGEVYVGKKTPAGVPLANIVDPSWTNLPGMLIPMYNGTIAFSPIRMRTHTDADVRTVSRAIEIFLQNRDSPGNPQTQEEADKVLRSTGYDVRTPQGLRQFVNQYYTYTEGFSKAKTLSDVNAMRNAGVAQPFFMLDIRDNGDIKVGWAYSGRKVVYALLGENGQLAAWFGEVLAEGLKTRTRNVTYANPLKGIRGINDSDGAFSEMTYQSSGKWVRKEHASYNDYLKDKSYTPLVGTNQVGSRFVYTANPQITYDVADVASSPGDTALVEDAETPRQIEEGLQTEEEGLTDAERNDLGNVFDVFMRAAPPHNAVGEDPNAIPLSLDALTEIYTFTPLELQNGKSPQQVFEELNRLGVGQLAPGFNPFLNCS